MAKRSRKSCFKHFGATPINVQWSRSARTADNKAVVVSLWQDKLVMAMPHAITYTHAPSDRWFKSPGQLELRDNLIWSRDKCGGIFSVVVVIAKDRTALRRSVANSEPEDRYKMRLTSLDATNGAFTAEAVWR